MVEIRFDNPATESVTQMPQQPCIPHTKSSYQTKRRNDLTRHKRRHETMLEKQKPYVCSHDDCEYRTGSATALSRHRKAKHFPIRWRNFPCALCSSWFYTTAQLRNYIRTHTKELHFMCNQWEFQTHLQSSLADRV